MFRSVIDRQDCAKLIIRQHIHITGAVQGVGFRPFVFNLAQQLGLNGWVRNDIRGLDIEIEGTATQLEAFLQRVQLEKPSVSEIKNISVRDIETKNDLGFSIASSDDAPNQQPKPSILPDLATCPECLQEAQDPSDRRYRYPFTSCTQCGPRWSIIESLPYDRPNTTMRHFSLCPDCQDEYNDPTSRRFHHQANTCPRCGPQLYLLNPQNQRLADKENALQETITALKQGKIIALKGIGGFQLLADASNEQAVAELRRRKQRPAKPLAIMCADLNQAQKICTIAATEQSALQSSAAPIVLLKRQQQTTQLAESIAPGNPYLGVMLPYSILHWLVLQDFKQPLVCTSGNVSGEPICRDEEEALKRLRHIADLFLVHDRPIARVLDDSVAQIVFDEIQLLRRARGYTPHTLSVDEMENAEPIIAVGAHIKNTIAFTLHSENKSTEVMLSAHLGDLDESQTREAFNDKIDNLKALYRLQPKLAVHDLHPDYYATQQAEASGISCLPVQHHWAHIAAVIAEHNVKGKVLGIAWDGVGLGDDGGAWGGEFLIADLHEYQRVGHLLPFPLPGGDKAARDCRRSLLGALYTAANENSTELNKLYPPDLLNSGEKILLLSMLQKNLNSIQTSSVGRLFDAAASLLNIGQANRFEGEAAMTLQFAAEQSTNLQAITLPTIDQDNKLLIDWRPLLIHLSEGLRNGQNVNDLARLFHQTLVKALADFSAKFSAYPVVLSGGCFQNRLLLTAAVDALRKKNIKVYWPALVPANDGGVAFGQAAIGLKKIQTTEGTEHTEGDK